MSTGIVILAAGNSSRLGRPKQLLHYNGKLLIDIVSEAALNSKLGPVIVILGSNADSIIKKLKPDYIVNDNWREGMSSSIVAGILYLLQKFPDLEKVILTVSDQVFISTEIFINLVAQQHKSGKGIVACRYNEVNGTPVLFNRKYFPDLIALQGDGGAKSVIKKNSADLDTILFAKGEIDIDTASDYNKLKTNYDN